MIIYFNLIKIVCDRDWSITFAFPGAYMCVTWHEKLYYYCIMMGNIVIQENPLIQGFKQNRAGNLASQEAAKGQRPAPSMPKSHATRLTLCLNAALPSVRTQALSSCLDKLHPDKRFGERRLPLNFIRRGKSATRRAEGEAL